MYRQGAIIIQYEKKHADFEAFYADAILSGGEYSEWDDWMKLHDVFYFETFPETMKKYLLLSTGLWNADRSFTKSVTAESGKKELVSMTFAEVKAKPAEAKTQVEAAALMQTADYKKDDEEILDEKPETDKIEKAVKDGIYTDLELKGVDRATLMAVCADFNIKTTWNMKSETMITLILEAQKK